MQSEPDLAGGRPGVSRWETVKAKMQVYLVSNKIGYNNQSNKI